MKKKVCVQGLGFVGAAMATAIALAENEAGLPLYDVVGVDLPNPTGRSRVAALNRGEFPFATGDKKLVDAVRRVHERGNLMATTDNDAYENADIVVVDIHLDIAFRDAVPELGLEGLRHALQAIGARMRADTLVIIETTVPPGACEKVVVPTLQQEFVRRGFDPQSLLVAHSYERVMPGDSYLDSIVNFWRVYAGHTPRAADECERFLMSVVNSKDFPLTRLSSTTASETAKVFENTYRAANIALVCEWTRYAEAVGIDLFEVVEAIQMRPTHANLRYPGLGIGGYCLTKDPAFAPAAARRFYGKDLSFPFSQLTLIESAKMPLHGVDRLAAIIGGEVAGKKVLLAGVSYRQDVSDTRFSPSEIVYRELVRRNALVDCHDPFVERWDELAMDIPKTLPDSLGYDAVIFAVPHTQYRELDLAKWVTDKNKTVVLDAYNVFSKAQRLGFRQQGVRIEAIGVGEGL